MHPGRDNPRDTSPTILVTGPSGAGRSTAIHALEDLGFETIDNLPLGLVPNLFDDHAADSPLALGIDTRNRDFSVSGLAEVIATLEQDPRRRLTVLYVDCNPDVLLRRYSATRRRHPLADTDGPEMGIAREIELLADVRQRADILIDTSELNIHQLRRAVEQWFSPDGHGRLSVTVLSFSYKRGLPHGADLVFDCRFLRNPHWQKTLRDLDGRHPDVMAHVQSDDLCGPFFDRVQDLIQLLIPAFNREGKSHLCIAFGCTGGQHRSVALAERMARVLAEDGQQVSIRHRELEGRNADERPI